MISRFIAIATCMKREIYENLMSVYKLAKQLLMHN